MIYKTIEAYTDPLNIKEYMEKPVCEISDKQQGFLCGLIKKYKPDKLVEVGVAEGGTSAVILNCLRLISPHCKMYSVDLNERLYYNDKYQTGYLLNEVYEELSNFNMHKMLLGKYLPEQMKEIGGDIDFVIMDTVHNLPGELLDFLCICPFLSNNAVVVLHDISLSTIQSKGICQSYATNVLFSSVSGSKYWNPNDRDLCNIAAIKLDETTKPKISDVFSALNIAWAYIPDKEEIELYRKAYLSYGNEYADMFKKIYMRQSLAYLKKNANEINFSDIIESLKNDEIYIYGAGDFAKVVSGLFGEAGKDVKGYVISDGQGKDEVKIKDSNILFLSEYIELRKSSDKKLIYSIMDDEATEQLFDKNVDFIYCPKNIFKIIE